MKAKIEENKDNFIFKYPVYIRVKEFKTNKEVIINFNCKELLNESNKKENEFVSLIQLYKQILLKRKVKTIKNII